MTTPLAGLEASVDAMKAMLRRVLGFDHINRSYAQYGEDLVIASIFHGVDRGFFVDVGAHHPKRFSNTYLLYRRGWRGINIDAMPGSMARFDAERPGDVNLEIGIDAEEGTRNFHIFSETALNTFDDSLAMSYRKQGWAEQAIVPIRVRTLEAVLDQYLAPDQGVDLLSIDIEGLDSAVLRSIDFSRHGPKVIISEMLDADCPEALVSETGQFLLGHGYFLHSKCGVSCIWTSD